MWWEGFRQVINYRLCMAKFCLSAFMRSSDPRIDHDFH
jgi:hypothetical protein